MNLNPNLGIRVFKILLVCIMTAFVPKIRAQGSARIQNIVLVHGAFVDGSGWRQVYEMLTKKGYKVSIAQPALTTFEGDVAAVKRVISQQNGPCILVGHSYGGAVITIAGNDPRVDGLVYIAAHAPDQGESEAGNGKSLPPAYKSLIKGDDGWDYIDTKMFAADFSGDLPKSKADFMANSQTPTADLVFHAVIQNPAWKTKPVWYMVAKSDRIINPELERMYAKRANSVKIVEVEGASHCVYITHPKEVADLIISATNLPQKNAGGK